MSETINLSLKIQVVGGPQLSESKLLEVDAYDKIEVVIEKETTNKEIRVQPGTLNEVRFLLIRSSKYAAELSYKVKNDGTVSGSSIKLDSWHLLMGKGAITLLGDDPKSLVFTNGLKEDVNIEILIGREAEVETQSSGSES